MSFGCSYTLVTNRANIGDLEGKGPCVANYIARDVIDEPFVQPDAYVTCENRGDRPWPLAPG